MIKNTLTDRKMTEMNRLSSANKHRTVPSGGSNIYLQFISQDEMRQSGPAAVKMVNLEHGVASKNVQKP